MEDIFKKNDDNNSSDTGNDFMTGLIAGKKDAEKDSDED